MPTVLGKYTIGKSLGEGASCKVKLAKIDSGTRYACKLLKSDCSFLEQVQAEVRALENLNHPNIVNLIE